MRYLPLCLNVQSRSPPHNAAQHSRSASWSRADDAIQRAGALQARRRHDDRGGSRRCGRRLRSSADPQTGFGTDALLACFVFLPQGYSSLSVSVLHLFDLIPFSRQLSVRKWKRRVASREKKTVAVENRTVSTGVGGAEKERK